MWCSPMHYLKTYTQAVLASRSFSSLADRLSNVSVKSLFKVDDLTVLANVRLFYA